MIAREAAWRTGRRSSRALHQTRTVLLFTLGVLVLAGLLFGLAPMRVALAGGAELALKTSAATSNADAGKSRTGRVIVALQMAAVRGVAGWRRSADSHAAQSGKYSPGNAVDGLVVFGVKPEYSVDS